MSYDRLVRRRARRRRTAWAARCGRWATAVQLARDEGQRLLARQMFERGLPFATELGPRGTALTMLGPGQLPDRASGGGARRRPAARAVASGSSPATASDADARLALVRADADLRQRAAAAGAVRARTLIAPRCGQPATSPARVAGVPRGGLLSRTIGWCWSATPAGIAASGAKADADEQPIDAAAFVLAFRGAYLATGDHHYLRRMRESFAWFLGRQPPGRPGLRLGHRGLPRRARRRRRQPEPGRREHGLLSCCRCIAMLELAGEGLEYAVERRRRWPTDVRSIASRARSHRLRHDPRRVIAKPYLPGEEIAPGGRPRAGAAHDSGSWPSRRREVAAVLARVLRRFATRHHGFERAPRAPLRAGRPSRGDGATLSPGTPPADRRLLHPRVLGRGGGAVQPVDRAGARPGGTASAGERRFVMSLRAVGEGHISSIEFRTGVIDARQQRDASIRWAGAGDRAPRAARPYDKPQFRAKLVELGAGNELAWAVLDRLPERFTLGRARAVAGRAGAGRAAARHQLRDRQDHARAGGLELRHHLPGRLGAVASG